MSSKKDPQRQIPSDKEYWGVKKCDDYLYGYLQHISQYDFSKNIHYLPLNFINYSSIARELKISRQTVSKYFKNLLDKKMIILNSETNRYELEKLPEEDAALVKQEVLQYLLENFNHHIIAIYAYFLKRYHPSTDFIFTKSTLRGYLGYSEDNRHTQVITRALLLLKKLSLIDYRSFTVQGQGKGQFETRYQLTYLAKTVPEDLIKEDFSIEEEQKEEKTIFIYDF